MTKTDTPPAPALLNCPFCGSKAIAVHVNKTWCKNKDCPVQRAPAFTYEQWNRRAPPPVSGLPEGMLERLKALHEKLLFARSQLHPLTKIDAEAHLHFVENEFNLEMTRAFPVLCAHIEAQAARIERMERAMKIGDFTIQEIYDFTHNPDIERMCKRAQLQISEILAAGEGGEGVGE